MITLDQARRILENFEIVPEPDGTLSVRHTTCNITRWPAHGTNVVEIVNECLNHIINCHKEK